MKAADCQPPAFRTCANEAPDATRSEAEPRLKPCHVASRTPTANAISRNWRRSVEALPRSKRQAVFFRPALSASRASACSAHGPHSRDGRPLHLQYLTTVCPFGWHLRRSNSIVDWTRAPSFRVKVMRECQPGRVRVPSSPHRRSKASDCALKVKW